ncbi:hypothetical protein PF003_g30194 [Phytophthora fragariae]|nr:hypothetical protein PF003_g30194 [Phytophthora fragariae]
MCPRVDRIPSEEQRTVLHTVFRSIDLSRLKVGFATFLESLFEIKGVSAIQKALLCQEAEHEYCNVLCGIVDQFISSVECNSNVKHDLNGGEYKERVLQCQAAVKALQTHGHPGMMHLRDASVPDLDSEECTVAAVDHNRARQYAEAGKLMFVSHDSLRDDYEVSTPELNRLVETARGCEGVFGAVMTDDFGHCIVVLVQQQHAQKLMVTLNSSTRRPKAKN